MRTRLFIAAFGILVATSMAAQFGAPTRPPMAPVAPAPVKPVFLEETMPPPGEPFERRTPTPLRSGNPQAASSVAADTSSVDAIIAALYASVSHPDGQDPDWARMRKIFLPVGMLVPPKRGNQDMFTVLDVDGFRDMFRQGMAAAKQRGETNAFYEVEVARQLDCFGNVCQAFSTYESRRAPTDEKPFTRGINSIQLLNDGQRWWIASIVWDSERPDNPIPPQYSKK